jgi:anti-sigma B factor antagonist
MKMTYREKTLALTEITELNAANSTAVRDGVRAALRPEISVIDVSLALTRLVDSSGLGALIALHKTMCSRGGCVRILNPTPSVQQILELTRLHRVFEIVSIA